MVFFSDKQKKFCEWVREFALREFREGALERGRLDHVSPEVIRKLAGAGLLDLGTSPKYLVNLKIS